MRCVIAFGDIVKRDMPLEIYSGIRQHPVMEIGRRIREARQRLNMTQEQLAKLIGAEQPTVSGWEKDVTRRPSRAMVPRLAKALKVSVNYLEFGGAASGEREFSHSDAHERAEHDAPLDHILLTDCIRMAMRSLIAPYGIEVSPQKYADAADAAMSSYLTYLRLKHEEDSVA